MQYQIRPLKNAASIDYGTGASVIGIALTGIENLAQEIQGCLRERPRGVRKSRKEFRGQRICLLPWIVCGFGPLKSPFTRPNRRKSVPFQIMRCNLLRACWLCRLYSLACWPIVGTIYNSTLRHHKFEVLCSYC
jgi:hypothetical protein